MIYILASQIVLYDMLSETQKVISTFDFDESIGALLYFKNIMLEDNIIYALHTASKSFPSLVLHNFTKNFTQKIVLANLEKEEAILELSLLNDFRNVVIVSQIDKIVRLSIVETVSKDIKYSDYLSFVPIAMHAPPQYPTKVLLHSPSEIYVNDIEGGIRLVPLGIKKHLDSLADPNQPNTESIVQMSTSLHTDFCLYIVTDAGNLYFATLCLMDHKVTSIQKFFLDTYATVTQAGQEVLSNRRPSCICSNEYNILIGYEHIEEFTLVKICSISTQPPSFESISFSCPSLHKIVRMNFAAETMAVCVMVQVKENDKHDFCIPIESQFLREKGEGKVVKQNAQNHLLAPGKIFPVIFNLLLYDTLVETLRSPVQRILNSMLLTKKILEICVLPTKKLILVLSADKKIKAIRFEHITSTSFEKMLAWEMVFNSNDQPATLDCHPLTFNVAVGFKEGVKIFNIFSDGMKTNNIHFPIKNCECVRYSRFGHLLVAGSSHQIILINPYENVIKSTFQLSHSYNTREISFIDRDMYLFGFFANGSSQVMSLEGNKIFEVYNKSSKCIHACYDPVFDILAVSYEDFNVKFYREHGAVDHFNHLWTYPFVVTKITIINELGTAFMGTSTGKVRAYQWPIKQTEKFKESYTEIQLHRAPVTQIKIAHDFSYLITGAEDGTVFISKITAFSDGMMVSDSTILHTFKVNKKNYSSLYYLQNLMCTNNSMESEKEERIVQYESDKSDFESEYTYVLQSLHIDIDNKLKEEEAARKRQLRDEIEPLECKIEEINSKKIEVRDESIKFEQHRAKEVDALEEKRVDRMRALYRDSDHLKNKLAFYRQDYAEKIKQAQDQYRAELQQFERDMQQQEQSLMSDCAEIEKEYKESLISYRELMKEEEEEGGIYKHKMMQQLDSELEMARHHGEELRKVFNKSNHDIRTAEDKKKYFEQLKIEMDDDIKNGRKKKENLEGQIERLSELLKQKDQQIFDEEKAVKELLKKSINNYSHEEYLKHKQDELIEKAKYLEKEIEDLDDKYRVFQDNFVEASKQTNEFVCKIEESYKTIEGLKQKNKELKKRSFVRRYQIQEIMSRVEECFRECHSKVLFAQKVKDILSVREVSLEGEEEQNVEGKVNRRDHLIDQVVNTNKLRKIEDTIKKTIMIKLNRETVNLTSEVNELRKEKKLLTTRMNELQSYIGEVSLHFPDKENPKDISSLTDIVPVNISVIRSQNSKHAKPLPFQLYQQNKASHRGSTYSKLNAKSIIDENSTQLPSINKNHSYSASVLEQSSLFGVQEYEDEIAQ